MSKAITDPVPGIIVIIAYAFNITKLFRHELGLTPFQNGCPFATASTSSISTACRSGRGTGECMATAYLDVRNLITLSQVGGHASGRNFSGEIFLALSTGNASADELAQDSNSQAFLPKLETQQLEQVKNETIDSLLHAVSEATEEAILNALCMAETLVGFKDRKVEALPLDKVQRLLDQHLYQKST